MSLFGGLLDALKAHTRESRFMHRVSRRARSRLSRDAWIALFDQESPRLLLFVARRVLDADIAVALVSETFARALLRRGRFPGTTRAHAVDWIHAVARNEVARFLASDSLELPRLTRLGLSPPHLEAAERRRLEQAAGIARVRTHAEPYLSDLPESQRQALRLVLRESRRYGEAAYALGLTERRVLASRALREIAYRLDRRNSPTRIA